MKRYNFETALGRRDFLKLTAASGTALLFSGPSGRAAQAIRTDIKRGSFLKKHSPIDRTIGDHAPKSFSGDQNTRPHKILWDIPNYLASKKISGTETTDLVIIGGGVSGLFTAFQLRAHKPIILEQAARFGGNAKGESFRGLEYSIGAAYIDQPHAGTPMFDLFKELDLGSMTVTRPEPDPVAHGGKLYKNFWDGVTEPAHKLAYQKMSQYFQDLNAEKNHAFPSIPSLKKEHWEAAKLLDRESLHTALTRICGGKLPLNLECAIEHYSWSTYAASAKELSAPIAYNLLAQESNPIRIAAGGNSAIAERVLERLMKVIPEQNFRPSSIAVQVKVENDRAIVLYENEKGELREIRAKSVVMSCPKFIAQKLIPDLETERVTEIKKLKYRSYMTANLCMKKKPADKFYDLFMPTNKSEEKNNATDVILANFAKPSFRGPESVLTFYRGFAHDGARAELYQPNAYETYRKRFEDQIHNDVLPLLKLKPSDAVDLRLTLWGHALPLGQQGIYQGNTIEWLRKPFRERVLFIEQDNWANPSLQTGATESALMRDQIKKVIG